MGSSRIRSARPAPPAPIDVYTKETLEIKIEASRERKNLYDKMGAAIREVNQALASVAGHFQQLAQNEEELQQTVEREARRLEASKARFQGNL